MAAERSVLYVAAVAAFYMAMSVLLVVLNKVLLSRIDMQAPMFVAWYQCVITAIAAIVMSAVMGSKTGFVKPVDFRLHTVTSVLPLALIFVIMLCTNNLSLMRVNVSFYPVARSLSILFTLIMEAMSGRACSIRVAIACCVVMAGFFVGAQGQINLSVQGTLWGVASSLFVSFYGVRTKSTLPAVGDSPWRLMAYNNICASVLLLPVVILFGESEEILRYASLQHSQVWMLQTLGGLGGFVLSLATFMLINTTTALTHLITGTTKNAVLEVVSILHLREQVTMTSLIGIVLNLGGSAWYAVLRHRERTQPAPSPLKTK